MQISAVVALLLSTSVFAKDLSEFSFKKMDDCNVVITEPGMYKAFYLKRGYICRAEIVAPLGHSINISVQNTGKTCLTEPPKVMVYDEDSYALLGCEGSNRRYESNSERIAVTYNPRTITYLSIEFTKHAIQCNESVGFHRLDKSLVLEHSGPEQCMIVLPGRAQVVVEKLELEDNDCQSHLEFRTGPHMNKMKFEARSIMCSDENGIQESDPITISCNKGVMYFHSASSRPESVTFRVQIVDDISRLVLSHYKCFD